MINDSRIQQRIIEPYKSILFALKKMDELGVKSLIVSSQESILDGIISIGDIQRAIIKNTQLENIVSSILRPNPRVLHDDISLEQVKDFMVKYRMEFLPLIEHNSRKILKVYFWSDFFQDKVMAPAKQFNLPVVIMAGGYGKRMKPLTNIIPKPLIPVGEKTIIENIFERFERHGSNYFYLSVNYKAELIDYYLREQKLSCKLEYIKEEYPMGTAGSLSLLKEKINKTFFVSNCDILIEQDYSEILEYHKENKNEITIIAALKHFPIPYGIIDTGDNGNLNELIEKPELTVKINSGMYILEPHLLNEIPTKAFFHITELIQAIKLRKGALGVYPVSEKSWKDIGCWSEYIEQAKL
jgi:dTDP-glucose pyrophosphorylase